MGVCDMAVWFKIVEQRDSGQRKIAAPAGEFLERPAPVTRPGRQPYLGDDLVRGKACRHRPEEEIHRLDEACAGISGDGDFGVAGHRDARHLGSRVGQRNAAADRATIADLVMRNMTHGCRQQRMGAGKFGIFFDVAPADTGTKPDTLRADDNAVEPRDAFEIDKKPGLGQPERQQGHQALPAGQHHRLIAPTVQQFNRFGKAGWAGIIEGRKFHEC